ncbi:MAG: DUF1292 domain-containing protein [Tissierellia bacterium]|nr:DUF1292 domain-containing protein [Tissierellia bacterium]
MDKIDLINENGKIQQFEIIDTFGVDDKDYAALKQTGDDRILILEIIRNGDSVNLSAIEDQEELDSIIETYEQMKEG